MGWICRGFGDMSFLFSAWRACPVVSRGSQGQGGDGCLPGATYRDKASICPYVGAVPPSRLSRFVDYRRMPTVDTTDLIDARGAAELLRLSHPNSVSTYQRRYRDMPRPVVDLGEGRCKLWLTAEVREWQTRRGREH